MENQKVTLKYALVTFVAVFFTWILHEFGHWITYEIFGFDGMMTLNKSGVERGQKPEEYHRIIAAAAGPFITLLQAVVFYFLLKSKGWNKYIYPLVFIPFYMRFLAGGMNYLSPNDEGVVGLYFGIGLYTISILISLILFWMVYKISKQYSLSKKFQGFTIAFVMFASSVLIMLDMFFPIRLL